jgi:hypothetical protein
MIYYTYEASETCVVGQFVQLSTDTSKVEKHASGFVLGLCRRIYDNQDNTIKYCEVYVAGGGGQQAILNSDWDGTPSRFDVVQSKVQTVSSGGIGWIIPNFPPSSVLADQLVYISIY